MSEHHATESMARWLRSIGIAVLGCGLALVILIGFVLWALYQVDGAVDDQGEVLTGQARAQEVSACQSTYAATYAAWDARAAERFGELIAISANSPDDAPVDTDALRAYTAAADNADEMARRRLGLAGLARIDIEFACPPLPRRLTVQAIEP